MRAPGTILAAALVLATPGPALACGAMVSETGAAELLGFEGLLAWDGTTEELLVSIDFQSRDPTFGWLMPLPAAPEIDEADLAPIDTAYDITRPPDLSGVVPELIPGGDGEGAPAVGAGDSTEVVDRQTVGGLRFVILRGERAADIGHWMRKHRFTFHDRQEPVLQTYLDRDWIVVAARAFPQAGGYGVSTLVPVRFTFPSEEPIYPLAMAGAGHQRLAFGMNLFVLTPFRPTSTTYRERIVEPFPDGNFSLSNQGLELRYSAPLGNDAHRMDASPHTWLTWYTDQHIRVARLTEDLILSRATDQAPIDYSRLREDLETQRTWIWVQRIALVAGLIALAVWISVRMARRRRARESPLMPGQGPPPA